MNLFLKKCFKKNQNSYIINVEDALNKKIERKERKKEEERGEEEVGDGNKK